MPNRDDQEKPERESIRLHAIEALERLARGERPATELSREEVRQLAEEVIAMAPGRLRDLTPEEEEELRRKFERADWLGTSLLP